MASPSSTVAFATTYAGSPNSGCILKWDGSTWSLMLDTGFANGYSCVYAFSQNDVWAIFSLGDVFPSPASIYHWDGATWTHTHETAYFLRMWGTAPNNLYALAVDNTNQLIYKWNGATWSVVYSQAIAGGRYFEQICGKDANAVIAAHYDSGNSDAMYNGVAWASKANPIPADNYLVRGLIYDATDDKYYIAARGGTILHISSRSTGYAPESWVTIDNVFVANSNRRPRALYKSGTEWWVLGEGSMLLHKVGATWGNVAPGGYKPEGIHGLGTDAIWVIGHQDYVGNVVLFWNGVGFTTYNIAGLATGVLRDIIVLPATTPAYASASAPGVGAVLASATLNFMLPAQGSAVGQGSVDGSHATRTVSEPVFCDVPLLNGATNVPTSAPLTFTVTSPADDIDPTRVEVYVQSARVYSNETNHFGFVTTRTVVPGGYHYSVVSPLTYAYSDTVNVALYAWDSLSHGTSLLFYFKVEDPPSNFVGPVNAFEETLLVPYTSSALISTEAMRQALLLSLIETREPEAAVRALFLQGHEIELSPILRGMVTPPTEAERAVTLWHRTSLLNVCTALPRKSTWIHNSIREMGTLGLPIEHRTMLESYAQLTEPVLVVSLMCFLVLLAKALDSAQ